MRAPQYILALTAIAFHTFLPHTTQLETIFVQINPRNVANQDRLFVAVVLTNRVINILDSETFDWMVMERTD